MADLSQISVRQYMSSQLLTFTPDTDMMTAIGSLVKSRHSGAPVCDVSGKLLGVLSEKDCLKVAVAASFEGVSPGLVQDFMSTNIAALSPDDTLLEAASRFLDVSYKRFPVMEGGHIVGQLSRSDILRAIHENS